MYQSQVRPDQGGRELVAQQQPKQHSSGRFDHSSTTQAIHFLKSSLIRSKIPHSGRFAFAASWLILGLSACGVSYRDLGTINAGGNTSTTVLSRISCGTLSLTGVQSKACSVYLSNDAKSPTVVKLFSNNKALKVPTAVTVPRGSNFTGFDAVSSAVSQTTAVTITGNAGRVTKTDVITLYPETSGASTLSKISCGTQTLTGPTTKACSVYLDGAANSQLKVSLSSSSSALQIPSSVVVRAGATSGGFTATASTVATTQTVILTASANGISQSDTIQLEGTGSPQPAIQYQVKLNWNAPSSTDPITGYRVYRSTSLSTYQLLNSSIDLNTNYTDTTVQGGQTYAYVIKSVDGAGKESAPSNSISVSIP